MFFHSHYNSLTQQRGVDANDIATSVFTIAFFIYATLFTINIMFQGFTKERIATSVDNAARYIATHRADQTTPSTVPAYVNGMMTDAINSTFIKTSTVVIEWSSNVNDPCLTTPANDCTNDIRTGGIYQYRGPFMVAAHVTIPSVLGPTESALIGMQTLRTTVYSKVTTEIVGP